MLNLFRAKRFGTARRLRIAFERLRALAPEKSAGREPRPNAECIGIANLVLGDHSPNFRHAKFAAIENRFSFVSGRCLFALLHGARQKETTAFVCKAG